MVKIFFFASEMLYKSRHKRAKKYIYEYFISLFILTDLNDSHPIICSHHCPICSAAAAIAVLMCRCEGAAFMECELCPTCLEVAAEIKHVGVKKCQSASPWLLHSTPWQRSGEACVPGMLYPSVNKKQPSLTDRGFLQPGFFDAFRIWLNSNGHVRQGMQYSVCDGQTDEAILL